MCPSSPSFLSLSVRPSVWPERNNRVFAAEAKKWAIIVMQTIWCCCFQVRSIYPHLSIQASLALSILEF